LEDENPLVYNDANIKKAIKKIEDFEADLGGTNIFKPVDAVLK